MDCGMLGFPVLYYLLEFAQIHVHDESVMPSNHLILCCPVLLLPSIFSSVRVFLTYLILATMGTNIVFILQMRKLSLRGGEGTLLKVTQKRRWQCWD